MNEKSNYSSTNVNKYNCRHPFVVKRLDTFFQSVTEMMSGLNTGAMLSLGCGEGIDLRRIHDLSSQHADNYYGLDFSLNALRMSLNILDEIPFEPVCGDVSNLPLRLCSFDLIICLELLEHLQEPRKLLEEISRQFVGQCIFSVPNEPFYRLARMFLFRQNIRAFGNHPEHINHWSAGAFKHLLSKYFTVKRVDTPFPWTVVLCQSRK
jgi:ubiquinone/menaquinone biosynthesis C-methylase UbiE